MNSIRILLVDDEAPTRTVIAQWLQRCGFIVLAVDGPASADRALASGTFDLVLTDVLMPGNVNLEWVERRVGRDSLPPFLLMTGCPELATALRAANLPVAGYIMKPLDYAATRERIEFLARDHRRRAELLSLAHSVLRLLATRIAHPTAEPDPYLDELHHLACELTVEAQRGPREIAAATDATRWREAVADTILVLDKARESLRSKELGALRERLLRLLPTGALAQRLLPCDPVAN